MLLTRMLDGFDGKEPASAGFLLADFCAMLTSDWRCILQSMTWTIHSFARDLTNLVEPLTEAIRTVLLEHRR
ncbi:hypothetical protein CUU62_26205 [Pseudomonas sp. WP001]|nr:hypothetical protein CUU62_26205 [Pseudomonas sp. WP001]